MQLVCHNFPITASNQAHTIVEELLKDCIQNVPASLIFCVPTTQCYESDPIYKPTGVTLIVL